MTRVRARIDDEADGHAPRSAGLDRALWGAILASGVVATFASLNFSGIGPLNWSGMGFFPCELCWYQRILMYPIPVLAAVGLLTRRTQGLHAFVLPFSVAGLLVAAYHVYVQAFPGSGLGQCFVGACEFSPYAFLGLFTIPQMSLAAFALVTGLAFAAGQIDEAET